MKSLVPSRARTLCALLCALLFVTAAGAKGGRNFSGYYDVSGVQEQGDLVKLTLHLQLFNHDDADARNVIVALMESAPIETLQGNFRPVKLWKHQRFIELSQEFSVSKREYAEWMSSPGRPTLVVLYQDAQGKTWQRTVQIGRRPLVPVTE